jgi:hypothetical protein
VSAAAASVQLVLMYAVFPLWVAAGLADWACHRHTRIEGTSGLRENLFHWLLLAQMGAAMLAVALLEVNTAILLLVLAAFLAHEFTTWIELQYVVPLRPVGPSEQMVHSFMEILPLAVLGLLAVAHWDQVLALLDQAQPDFSLRGKEQPWPPAYLWSAFAAALAFNLLPMAEETLRCVRGRKR